MRRGGHRQRQAQEQEIDNRPSHLARYLYEKFAFGLISAVAVQTMARLVVRDSDGEVPEELRELAGIGSSGVWASNCYRDLMRILEPRSVLSSALVKCKVPLLALKRFSGRQLHMITGWTHVYVFF